MIKPLVCSLVCVLLPCGHLCSANPVASSCPSDVPNAGTGQQLGDLGSDAPSVCLRSKNQPTSEHLEKKKNTRTCIKKKINYTCIFKYTTCAASTCFMCARTCAWKCKFTTSRVCKALRAGVCRTARWFPSLATTRESQLPSAAIASCARLANRPECVWEGRYLIHG